MMLGPNVRRTISEFPLEVLQRTSWLERHSARSAVLYCFGITACCGAVYGSVMGLFPWLEGGSPWQIVYSALKLPLLLVLTFCLVLPSYCVIITLLQLRDQLRTAVTSLLMAQAAMTVILVSLAPITLLLYVSGPSYTLATLFNAGLFGLSSWLAKIVLERWYKPLIAANEMHRTPLRIWLFLQAFAGIQLAWVFRPFIGDPEAPLEFFRPNAWSNAYIAVFQLTVGLLKRWMYGAP